MLGINVSTKVQTRIINCATRQVEHESPEQSNLILDRGLNALAFSTDKCRLANFFSVCRVGSGTDPNSFASGAITFTQAGTTVTASGGFFTPEMVGMLFKWGTGSSGAEYYITAYISATQVTVDTSATVSTPQVATVWNVSRTTLQAHLYNSSSYETTAGANSTIISGGQVTMKRTFNFANQVASYNVNEIGYFNSTAGTTVFGRLVLSSPDVVPPTSFYQVVLTIVFTFTPNAPTAVANVGTNIDTSGNAMLEALSGFISTVNSNGASSSGGIFDDEVPAVRPAFRLITGAYSQNASVGSAIAPTTVNVSSAINWAYAGVRGKRTLTYNTTITTSGQTLYGLALCNGTDVVFDVKLTSPYALPTGSFLPQAVFSLTFNRTLTN